MNNTVTQKQIDEIVKNSTFDVKTVFDKCTVVTMKLPNGFVLTESSACVDPKNYDRKLGERLCREKLINKIWELEGYRLQSELHEKNKLLTCRFVVNKINCFLPGKGLTIGKIYEVKNGYFIADSELEFPLDNPLRDVESLSKYLTDIDFTIIVE